MDNLQRNRIKNILSDYNMFFALKQAYINKQSFYTNIINLSKKV